MHGFNQLCEFIETPSRTSSRESTDAKEGTNLEGYPHGFTNLFGPPTERFSANGLAKIEDAQGLMARLRNFLLANGSDGFWTDKLGPNCNGKCADTVQDNPFIASGYTYLLQLVAHDLVFSAVSSARDQNMSLLPANTRSLPLVLETIYGGGPDVCPHAYEYDQEFVLHGSVNFPRSRLRVGLDPTDGMQATAHCPRRDIARGIAKFAKDRGTLNDWTCEQRNLWPTESLLADVRNDSHALISQLTVVFHLVHNRIVDLLTNRPSTMGWPLSQLTYRRFLCARTALALIYREIIKKDILRLFLDCGVYNRYVVDKKKLLGFQSPIWAMPYEFSHGAFRFGHTIVRDEYMVNSDNALPTTGAILSSGQSPHRLPMGQAGQRDWRVDWGRFFDTGSGKFNMSQRIGPFYPSVLENRDWSFFPPQARGDAAGVAFRDNMGAYLAPTWSVPALISNFKSALRDNSESVEFVADFQIWARPMSEWFNQSGSGSWLTAEDTKRLVADPPLPLFILFEAAHTLDNTCEPVRTGGGQRLGRLGSMIVAETIIGAMQSARLGEFDDDMKPLSERIEGCCGYFLSDKDALSSLRASGPDGEIRDIETVSDLFQLLN